MAPHRLLPVLLLSLLMGCSGFSLAPHRIDVQQGNALDEEAVVRLKPGLTRSQVRFLLGTPLLVDPFRNNRWDYVYVHRRAGVLTEQKRITLLFEGEVLVRMQGDLPPAVSEAVAAATAQEVVPQVASDASPPVEESPQKPDAGGVEPVLTTPAPAPVAAAAPAPEDLVLAAVQAWAEDWSRRDAKAYFAHYADDYRPQSGTRKDWENRRRHIIERAVLIEVRIESPKVERLADGHATLSFDQYYRSNTYQDAVRKQLDMVERDGRWLIVGEHVLSNLGGKQP